MQSIVLGVKGNKTYAEITLQKLVAISLRQRNFESNLSAATAAAEMAVSNGWVSIGILVGVRVPSFELLDQVEGGAVHFRSAAVAATATAAAA